MSNNFSEKADQSPERRKEKAITNSPKNRSFIDQILLSHDETAVRNLFEEYFDLHAAQTPRHRITWDELRFLINELLQRNNDELSLNEATTIFYHIYQLQYSK